MSKIIDEIEKNLDDAFKSLKKTLNKITINDETFEVQGKSIVVKNNSVYVNGKLIKDKLSDDIHVKFEGDLASLDCSTATINGNVQGDVDGTTINVQGSVGGDVDGTTVNCGNVKGDVDGTTVNCGDVKGDVDAVTVKRK